MQPTLGHIDIVCTDTKASVAFYRRLGLDIPTEAVWKSEDDPHHVVARFASGVELALDSIELTRRYDPGWTPSPRGAGVYLVFNVPAREDVDETYADMVGAGYEGHLAPFDAFWGARYAIISDPDGNKIGVMSPSNHEHEPAPEL
jgi:catechol 2,3-dioxygenase-like lactoylglutathione lyase family enzyme